MNMLKVWKKLWEPIRSFLLNSTPNPAKLGWKWAGLAVLFSRQLPNRSHNFFQSFSICFFNYFIKNPQTTIALTFLTHIISAIGGVCEERLIFFVQFLKILLLKILIKYWGFSYISRFQYIYLIRNKAL